MACESRATGELRRQSARRSQTGFTIAELAVVTVLIGLLVSLIVMGDGVLTQARIKSLANEFEQLKVAVLTYQDRYGALPGDDTRAASRWVPGAKNGTGDGRISGSYQDPPPLGNPLTALNVDAISGESLNFWWHLRLAQLVVAPPPVITPIAQPLNYYSGVLGVEWSPFGFPRLAVCTANLPADIAIGIESQLDDGNARRGLVRAARQNVDNEPISSANASVTLYDASGSDMYIVCRRLD